MRFTHFFGQYLYNLCEGIRKEKTRLAINIKTINFVNI
jgi:hypothetical protein